MSSTSPSAANPSSEPSSAISEPVRAVLAVFAGPLAEVRFPDVDGEQLAASAAEVEAQRAELQRALEAVVQARAVLEAGQAQLLNQAKKAHAYASIYAAGNPELVDALAAIRFDASRLAPKKRRGRPSKSASKKRAAAESAPASKADEARRQASLAVADSDAA